MATPPPPPTETPAPLSTQAQVQADIEVRLRMSLGWSKSRDALCEEAAIEIADLRARNEALTAERDLILAGFNEAQALAAEQKARAEAAESTIARHVAALQEIGKGVEADQATIARLTAERDNALADADNDRSLAASRQREVARLSEELAQADAFVALNCDHHGQVWTRQVMGIAEREDMITRHRARHDTEGR